MSTALLYFCVLSTLAVCLYVASRHRALLPTTGVLLSWLTFTGVIAASGYFLNFSVLPPRLQRVLLPGVVLTIVFCFSRFGRAVATQTPLRLLVGYQAFRIPVELMLWSLHRDGLVPAHMTFEGRNFDIVTGTLALILCVVPRPARWSLYAFNLIGFALLINVVGLANLSFPSPFQRLPELTIVAHYPFVWLPTFLVPLALAGHLLLFRKLHAPLP